MLEILCLHDFILRLGIYTCILIPAIELISIFNNIMHYIRFWEVNYYSNVYYSSGMYILS